MIFNYQLAYCYSKSEVAVYFMYFRKTWALQEGEKKKPYIYLCPTSENSVGPGWSLGVNLNKGKKSFTDCSGGAPEAVNRCPKGVCKEACLQEMEN